MKTPKFFLVAVAALSFLGLNAQLPIGVTTVPKNPIHVSVDKINNTNRDGVTRISCTLIGNPHTSSRVDSCTFIVNGQAYGAVDIDGVDFKRYFQWEDNGQIPIEVDFPRQTKFQPDDRIVLHTVSGDCSTRLGDKVKSE